MRSQLQGLSPISEDASWTHYCWQVGVHPDAQWTTTVKPPVTSLTPVLQHADNLRLKRSDFDVLGRIGEGQFGVVDAVRSKLDGKVYAMKTIEKSMAQRAGSQLGLAYERHLHSLAGDGPVPSLATAFQSPSSLHIVTGYAPCGSLWDRLCEALPTPGLDTARMGEDEVAWWGKQMVHAIAWVHDNGYAHRDIKPHNFLILEDGRLWLTDFGSAAPLTEGYVARRHCLLPAGTPDYVAPEVLRQAEVAMIEAAQSMDESMDSTQHKADLEGLGYTPDVDWWSLGATLYEMAVGRAPFWAPSIGATYERVVQCDLRMPEHLSPQLKSLLSGLLSPHDVRLGSSNVAEIESHYFFNLNDTRSPPSLAQPIDLDTLAESFVHDFDNVKDMTFDHLFDASTISAMTSMSIAPSPSVWSRWVGWSLDPQLDFFGDEPPTVSPVRPSPVLFTPLRRGPQTVPLTVTRTAPRSVPRTRPVSERRAFAELVQCVEASARKKLDRTKPPSSASSTSSVSSPWQKEQPPTPTPMSREVSAFQRRPLSRTSSRAASEELVSSRKDDTLLARLAAVDTLLDEPSVSRKHVRTKSNDTFLLRLLEESERGERSESDERAERSGSRDKEREETPLARFSVGQAKPLEVSVRQVTRTHPHAEKPVDKERRQAADDKLARLVGIGGNTGIRNAKARQPAAPSTKEARPPSPYSSLEACHAAMESNISNLERRLGEMTARWTVV